MGESLTLMETPSGRRARRYYAYLLRCADGTYYAGYTVDLGRRLRAHRLGRASRYTRGRGPHRLVAVWWCPTQHAALTLERVLKRLSHAEKRRLAAGHAIGLVAPRARGIGARHQHVCYYRGVERTSGRAQSTGRHARRPEE